MLTKQMHVVLNVENLKNVYVLDSLALEAIADNI